MKTNNFEKEQAARRAISKKDNSEKEQFWGKWFWNGNIWKKDGVEQEHS